MSIFTRETPIELQCPVCKRIWTPTMFDDFCLPTCGCYGTEADRDTPCESCGINHAWNCPNVPGRKGQSHTGAPNLVEFWPDGTEVHKGRVK